MSSSIYLALDMENDLVHVDGPNGKAPYGEQARAAYPDRVERHCAVRADVQDTDAGASEQSGPILFVTGTIRSRFGADMPKSTRMTHNGDWVWRSDRDRHFASRVDHGAGTTGEWPICHGVSRRAFNERGGAGFEIS